MTITLNPQTQKALAVAAGAVHWTRLPTGAYRIPSQSDPAESYVVTPQMCNCPSAERHPERLCKHSIAVNIVQTLLEADIAALAGARPINEAEAAALFARL